MIEVISGSIASLKGAIDIAKGMNATLDAVKLAEVRMDLLMRLSEVQMALAQAREEISLCRSENMALKAELEQARKWNSRAEEYELAEAGRGAMAYRLKDAHAASQPAHWLCPNCFEEKRASFLIPERRNMMQVLHCKPCGYLIATGVVRNA